MAKGVSLLPLSFILCPHNEMSHTPLRAAEFEAYVWLEMEAIPGMIKGSCCLFMIMSMLSMLYKNNDYKQKGVRGLVTIADGLLLPCLNECILGTQ
jgi:hypothetical protein